MTKNQRWLLLEFLNRHPLVTEAEARQELGLPPPDTDREDIEPVSVVRGEPVDFDPPVIVSAKH